MKLFRLKAPRTCGEFAMFSSTGTWTKIAGATTGELCPECKRSPYELTEPLLIAEMDESRRVRADFYWSPFECAVTAESERALRALGDDFEFAPVRVLTVNDDGSPRTNGVFDDVPVTWLRARETARLDFAASGIEPLVPCTICKRAWPEFGTGFYTKTGLVVVRPPTARARSFWIDARGDTSIYVDESLAEQIRATSLTNVDLQLVGNIEG